MNTTASATPLLDAFRQRGIFAGAPFTLIDAGCRGGIASAWRRFAPDLVAHGFDPLVDECERLSRIERLPTVHYHPQYLGLADDDPFAASRRGSPPPNRNPWSRLSASRAMEILSAQQPAAAPAMADPASRTGITDFAAAHSLHEIDFLKIDVDGDDYGVLRSAEGALRRVLGISIEVNYIGSDVETDNTFHNIDRYARAQGFDLFAINARLYSSAALPAPFAGRAPGATTSGRPLQGHALYLRDLAAAYRRDAAQAFDTRALATLAALFELFRLPDCAAELIVAFNDRFAEIGPTGELLDLVASGVDSLPYREQIRRFEHDPLAGSAEKPPRPTAVATDRRPDASVKRIDEHLSNLRARLEVVQQKLRSCRDRSVTLARQNARLRAHIRATESSLVWRLTGPWRRLRDRRSTGRQSG